MHVVTIIHYQSVTELGLVFHNSYSNFTNFPSIFSLCSSLQGFHFLGSRRLHQIEKDLCANLQRLYLLFLWIGDRHPPVSYGLNSLRNL